MRNNKKDRKTPEKATEQKKNKFKENWSLSASEALKQTK